MAQRECQNCFKPWRQLVPCSNTTCTYETCRLCVKEYFSSGKPLECMACHVVWTRHHVKQFVCDAFLKHEYRGFEEKNVLGRELALVTDTMPFVEVARAKRAAEQEVAQLNEKRMKLQQEVSATNAFPAAFSRRASGAASESETATALTTLSTLPASSSRGGETPRRNPAPHRSSSSRTAPRKRVCVAPNSETSCRGPRTTTRHRTRWECLASRSIAGGV